MTTRRSNGEGSVYERKDGRWVVSWVEHTPEGSKRRSMYCRTRKEAREALKSISRRRDDGLPAIDSAMPLRDWIAHWQDSTLSVEGVSGKTQRVYRDVLRLHVVPVIGDVALKDLRATHVEVALSRMADKGLSPAYRHQAHKALSKCLGVARRDDLIARNPMDGVRAPRGGHKAPVVPTRDQVLQLLDVAPDARMRAFVAVLTYTGVRISEGLSIRWRDVDLERSTISVLTGKGGKSRAVPIAAGLRVELAAWRKAQATERLSAVWWDDSGDWVLSSEVGTQWEAHNARKRFRPMARSVCPGLTPHGLRHATATVLLEEGVPMKVVAELLGHSSTRITENIYSHVTARLVQEAAEAMDRALGG